MQFRDAENCYRQVLSYDKTHPRATLFFKDCLASRGMFIDESLEKQNDLIRRQMEIPVTDFELSVRSRNCLRKMNIRTLGDLTRTTEAALLASKNFGETSLAEIKQMMESKNLRLGMALEAGLQAGAMGGTGYHDPVEDLSPEDKALLAKPINDLNLSVRARKCMSKLGINTVGELLIHTGDELLECKNFGVTSLNEVREKLDDAESEAQERVSAATPSPYAPRGEVIFRRSASSEWPRSGREASARRAYGTEPPCPARSTSRRSPRTPPPRARRPPAHPPRLARNPGLHARRHAGDGQGPDPGHAPRRGVADGPRQHVSPRPPAGRGGRRRARRPAPVHGLGRPDPHRLGRLPGLQPRGPVEADRGRASPSGRTWTGGCSS